MNIKPLTDRVLCFLHRQKKKLMGIIIRCKRETAARYYRCCRQWNER